MDRVITPEIGRRIDIAYLFERIQAGEHCSLVALSNMGKSTIFRLAQTQGGDCLPSTLLIYVDCNRMLGMTDQGFYELILRCMRDAAPDAPALADYYQKVTADNNSFQVALAFNEAITRFIQTVGQPIALLLDEFDEPLRRLDSRVLLNLRALSDSYPGRLLYAVATNIPLPDLRSDQDVDEFCELFAHHRRYLLPLSLDETRAYAQQLAQHHRVTFDEHDIHFVYARSGGHPALIAAICEVLGDVTGAPQRDPLQDQLIHRQVSDRLSADPATQAECRKLWDELMEAERDALLTLFSSHDPNPETLQSLAEKRLVICTDEGPRVFSGIFEDYVRRQRVVRRGSGHTIRVDADSGEVWVAGRLAPTLTQLEYRLVMLLYGHLGKICDKYEVVEAVWGQDYIDEVDDARIEKLISRLRQKLEPDPANPQFLVTVRGRGYKLVDE
jgi:hypothetical protein